MIFWNQILNNYIYKLKLLLIIFFLICSSANAQWFQQNSGTNQRLNSVYFINQNTGFSCGYSTVLKTMNGGANWTKQSLIGNLNSVWFINEQTGFICGDSGRLYKSIDAGNSWNLIPLNTFNHLKKIKFKNNTGIIVGNKTSVYKSTNAGLNWSNVSVGIDTLDLLNLQIFSEQKFFVTGTESVIYKTFNGGISYTGNNFGMPNPLFSIDFYDDNRGVISGCCGMLLRTENGGNNWSPEVYLTPGYTVHGIQYLNSSTYIIASEAGIVYRTTNNGTNWDSLATNIYVDYFGMHFVNYNYGWIVGNSGVILATTNGGGTGFPIGISNVSSTIPENFTLKQNYPNPFNPETNIEFSIKNSGVTVLEIFDISGKLVDTPLNQNLTAGSYSLNWKSGNLASGIYFYKLTNNYLTLTKKFIITK